MKGLGAGTDERRRGGEDGGGRQRLVRSRDLQGCGVVREVQGQAWMGARGEGRCGVAV